MGELEYFVLISFNMLELWGYGPYFNLTNSEVQLAGPRP